MSWLKKLILKICRVDVPDDSEQMEYIPMTDPRPGQQKQISAYVDPSIVSKINAIKESRRKARKPRRSMTNSQIIEEGVNLIYTREVKQ